MSGLLGLVESGARSGARTVADTVAGWRSPDDPRPAWSDERAGLVGISRTSSLHVTPEIAVVLDGWVEIPTDGPAHPVDEAAHGARRVAEAWTRWGVDLVRYVHGEYVIAIVERRTGVLHLLRDPVGTRPAWWARTAGAFAFAQRIEPLLDLPWVSRALERDHLAEFLAFRAVHAPRTLLRDVHQLPPGHRLRADADGVRVVRTFEPTYAAPGTAMPRVQDVVPEIRTAIERALLRRLAGAGRVGMYLSGGVGSSVLVAAARHASRTVRTFTVAFAEEPYPESPFAGRVAQLLGMEHTLVTVGSREVADRFDDAVGAVGHPVGNVAAVLQLELARAAARHVDVVLTGDGTDQLFGGAMLEGPARELRRVEALHRLPAPVRALLGRAVAPLGRGASLRVSPREWPLRHGVGGVHLFDPEGRAELLLDPAGGDPDVRTRVLRPYYEEVDTDVLNRVLHAFWQSTLVADTLPRVAGTAAAVGLDVGFPLLDRQVQRVAQVLPGAFKVHGIGQADLPTRWLLRASLQGALPVALVNRPDRGLPRPLDDWLTGGGRLFLEDRFAQLRADPLQLFHTTALEALKRGLGRSPGASQRMWALLVLDSWLRRVRAT